MFLNYAKATPGRFAPRNQPAVPDFLARVATYVLGRQRLRRCMQASILSLQILCHCKSDSKINRRLIFEFMTIDCFEGARRRKTMFQNADHR